MSISINKKKPPDANYIMLIQNSWKDIHHSRIQEWSALGVVTGAHLGIATMLHYLSDIPYVKEEIGAEVFLWIITSGFTLSFLFAIVGGLLTMRHRTLMKAKLKWIEKSELIIGLIKEGDDDEYGVITPDNSDTDIRWRELTLPRLTSTSGLIFIFYCLFGILDAGIIILNFTLN